METLVIDDTQYPEIQGDDNGHEGRSDIVLVMMAPLAHLFARAV